MNTYENEYTTRPRKRSPYEDSPYECVYTQQSTSVESEVQYTSAKPQRKRRGMKPILAIALIVACCVGTALGVSFAWQSRMDKMEAAMNDKFNVLKQLYEESKLYSDSQIANQGPLTPGEVYAKNVQAVVTVYAMLSNGQAGGSGFFISADGYLVTNYHVVEDASQIVVVTHTGETLNATLMGYDADNDVAVLKADGENLPYTTLGSSDAMAIGDQVAVIGNPLGDLKFSLTVGYIGGKDRSISTGGEAINMLQIDAAINSGNSGGPVFDMNGKVIGIITAKRTGNSGTGLPIEGLGFAIPVDDVADIIWDVKEYGHVKGSYLGVYVRDVDPTAQSYGLPAGAFVESAEKGFAAERGGIKAGDIIVAVGGYDVDSVTSLTRALRKLNPGETVSAVVYRSGRTVYLSVTLDEKPVTE